MALAYAREGADVVISYLNEHDDAKVCLLFCLHLPDDQTQLLMFFGVSKRCNVPAHATALLLQGRLAGMNLDEVSWVSF